MSNNIKKSRFLIPYKNRGKKSDRNMENWENMKIASKYLTENIGMLFRQGEDSVCRFQRLKKSAYSRFGLGEGTIQLYYKGNNNGEKMHYEFRINDIFEAQFITGVSIFVLDIGYDATEELKNIANIGFAISHLELRGDVEKDLLINTSGKNPYSNISFEQQHDNEGEKRTIIFSDILKKMIVGDREKDDIEITGRIIAYHNLVIEQECTEDNCMLFFLRRCRKYIENKDYACCYDESLCKCPKAGGDYCQSSYEKEIEFKYENSKNIILSGCSNGVVSLAKSNNFVKNCHVKNIYKDYFLLFLYVVHEREVLLGYSSEIVGCYNDEKRMFKLKDQMMRFNVLFGFNLASQEMAYQKFYENLYKAFRLEMLEKETQEILGKLTEFQEKKRKARTGKILGIISVVSLFSAIKIFAEFIRLIPNIGEVLSYVIAASIVIVAIFVGYVGVRLKERKEAIFSKRKK